MVGLNGLEPTTSPLSGVRSNHLSYRPIRFRRLIILPRHSDKVNHKNKIFRKIFSGCFLSGNSRGFRSEQSLSHGVRFNGSTGSGSAAGEDTAHFIDLFVAETSLTEKRPCPLVNPLHLIQRIRWSFQSLWAPDFPAADTAGCTDIYSEDLYIPSSPNNSRTL